MKVCSVSISSPVHLAPLITSSRSLFRFPPLLGAAADASAGVAGCHIHQLVEFLANLKKTVCRSNAPESYINVRNSPTCSPVPVIPFS